VKVSIISSFLGPEQEGIPKLARMGYRRVEANRREKTTLPAPDLRALCAQHNIEIHSLLGSDRRLVGPDPQARQQRLAMPEREPDLPASCDRPHPRDTVAAGGHQHPGVRREA